MRRRSWIVACLLGACLSVASCAAVDARPDFARAREEIRAATGRDEVYDPEVPVLTPAEIADALVDGLELDEALRLALLNNRRLQAGFQRLGIARAEFVQAGLLSNPSLSVAFLLPSGGGRTRLTADLAGSVSELWQLPARKDLAAAGLERELLLVSQQAAELVLETRRAYCESLAARAARALAAEAAELARQARTAVGTRVERGVAELAEEHLARSQLLGAELVLQRSERAEAEARRRLAAALSLEGDLLAVELTDALPTPAPVDVEREALVQRSRGLRLDLRASSAAVAAAEAAVALEERRRFPSLDLGLSGERPEGGSSSELLLGPSAALELPIFDQNQAQLARAGFRLAELRMEHEALLAEAAQGVRTACDRAAVAARSARFVAQELLPQAEAGLALTRRSFELGDTTVPVLLESQRALVDARRALLDARLEAALARFELERELGGPLAVGGSGGDG